MIRWFIARLYLSIAIYADESYGAPKAIFIFIIFSIAIWKVLLWILLIWFGEDSQRV